MIKADSFLGGQKPVDRKGQAMPAGRDQPRGVDFSVNRPIHSGPTPSSQLVRSIGSSTWLTNRVRGR
jgi:hypothetical protein